MYSHLSYLLQVYHKILLIIVVVKYSTFDFSSMYLIPVEYCHPTKVLNTAPTAFIMKVT